MGYFCAGAVSLTVGMAVRPTDGELRFLTLRFSIADAAALHNRSRAVQFERFRPEKGDFCLWMILEPGGTSLTW